MTDRIKILFPDGKVYPIKSGGYTKDEPQLDPKYGKMSKSEFNALESEIKKKVLENAVQDVKTAYTLFIPSFLVSQLVSGWKTNPKTSKDSIGILVTSKLHAIKPDGTKIPITIKKVTRAGNKGAARAWIEGRPFAKLSKGTVERMVREGENLVGVTFSPSPSKSEQGALTLGLSERKREKSRRPTVRGDTGSVNVARKKGGAKKFKGKTRMIQDPNNKDMLILQKWVPKNEMPENEGKTVSSHKGDTKYERSLPTEIKGHWITIGKVAK